jgi:hypothetical protein
MFLGSKVQPARGANNLTTIYELLSRKCGILNISEPIYSTCNYVKYKYSETFLVFN